MSSSERIPLMKRSIFWLVILIMIAGATYIYEKDLFSNGLEAITVSTNSKKLPIYRVNTDKPMVALSFDAAWGKWVKGASDDSHLRIITYESQNTSKFNISFINFELHSTQFSYI